MKANLLGSKLVKKGIITEEQLSEALRVQKKREEGEAKSPIDEILAELGFCSEDDIATTLSEIFGVPFINSENISISEEVVGILSSDLIEKYQAVPLWIENSRLVVALKNFNNIVVATENISVMTNYGVKPVVLRNSDFRKLFEKALDAGFGGGSSFSSKYSTDIVDYNEGAEENIVATESEEEDKPAIELVNLLFEQAAKMGASDIHIDPHSKGVSVLFRIDGVLHKFMDPPARLKSSLASRVKVLSDMDIAERRLPQDGRITIRSRGRILDVRVASLPTHYGEKLTLRVVDRDSQMLTLSDLGFTDDRLEAFKNIASLPYGFILVAGPTGSGKSTSLYATLIHVNEPGKHTVTIEDPIERRVVGLNQAQVNRQAGLLFSTGLRSLMRNDPDIIMVGEIRDRETAQIAVESSLTGHLVMSTIHTNDAAGAVTRLVEMGIEPFLVASSLIGVVAQRLMRVLCLACREPITLSKEDVLKRAADFPLDEGEEQVTLYEPVGCDACHNTGYKGRIGVFEVLTVTKEIKDAVLERAPDSLVKERAISQGMGTMRQDGLDKVKQGITSLKELARVVRE